MSKIFWKSAKWAIVTGICAATFVYAAIHTTRGFYAASDYATIQYVQARDSLVRWIKPPVSVTVPGGTLKEIITDSATRHSVDPILALAMFFQESNFFYWTSRFEPGLKAKMRSRDGFEKKFPKEKWMLNPENFDVYFTSYGFGQVIYGLHKEECGLTTYAQLIEPDQKTNIECAMTVFSNCLKRRKSVLDDGERIRLCLVEYNGGEEYAPKIRDNIFKLMFHRDEIYETHQVSALMRDKRLAWNQVAFNN